MKALVYSSNHTPSVFLTQRAEASFLFDPQTGAAFEDQVLLDVEMVGLCRTDLFVATGKIQAPSDYFVLGHEFSSRVRLDPKGLIPTGTRVATHPLINRSVFLGLDIPGVLCEQVWMPRSAVFPCPALNALHCAYLEPISASMAVLKPLVDFSTNLCENHDNSDLGSTGSFSKQHFQIGNSTRLHHAAARLFEQKKRIVLVGSNRIATLTGLILDSYGFMYESISESQLSELHDSSVDIFIETVFNSETFSQMTRALNYDGLLITKSRSLSLASINASQWVKKELSLKGSSYAPFVDAISWVHEHGDRLAPLLGAQYPLDAYEAAFAAASSADSQKIFISI